MLFPHLDERQRRLPAAAEARSLGHGGIRAVARAAGMSETTICKGMPDLETGESLVGRVRRSGGGRKRVAPRSDLTVRPGSSWGRTVVCPGEPPRFTHLSPRRAGS